LTQEAEAAAMKMFGNLTRTVKPFYPNRLVCKRFNVRNPHPDHDPTTDKAAGRTQAGSKDALSKESMESMLNERMPLTFTSSSKTPEPLSLSTDDPMMKAVVPKPSERTADQKDTKAPTTGVDVIKKDEDEDEGGPPLDYERPSMDIFKAIFDDSDSEDEEEEEEKQEIKQEIKEESKMVITAPSIDNQDDFIGPPAPPQASTADIPMAIVKDTSSNTETPFRPMFKRASERKESSNPLTHVISEEVVVQPFKPRSSGHKRRHVSVSEDEDEEDYKKTKTSSSRRSERDKDEDRQSRHHHHKHKSSKHKRSKSRDRSKSRERSSRHKSSSSRRDRKSSHKKRDKEDEQDEYEGMWVEKEPPVVIQTTTGHRKKEGRMSAADMW
jgi:G patch domain-containing protein 1